MKKKLGLLIIAGTVLLTFIVMVIVFIKQKDGNNFHQSSPKPTQVMENKMDEEKQHEDREKFIELMHSAAPGTNWRKMDADLRYQKMKTRGAVLSGG